MFPNGTIDLTNKPTGTPTQSGSKQKCLAIFHEKGAYTLTGDTGAYTGISGSGRFSLSSTGAGIIKHGKCDTSSSSQPAAAQPVITAGGPVTSG